MGRISNAKHVESVRLEFAAILDNVSSEGSTLKDLAERYPEKWEKFFAENKGSWSSLKLKAVLASFAV